MEGDPKPRGPLESAILERIRAEGLAGLPDLEAHLAGREPTADERINLAVRMSLITTEAVLMLARHLDEHPRAG